TSTPAGRENPSRLMASIVAASGGPANPPVGTITGAVKSHAKNARQQDLTQRRRDAKKNLSSLRLGVLGVSFSSLLCVFAP
ncbi:MAG: hypothetical protein KIT52_20075, partial [Anaerolineae bacterium]|nr:hypothetical protein [Anaerolineae bacterium]